MRGEVKKNFSYFSNGLFFCVKRILSPISTHVRVRKVVKSTFVRKKR